MLSASFLFILVLGGEHQMLATVVHVRHLIWLREVDWIPVLQEKKAWPKVKCAAFMQGGHNLAMRTPEACLLC